MTPDAAWTSDLGQHSVRRAILYHKRVMGATRLPCPLRAAQRMVSGMQVKSCRREIRGAGGEFGMEMVIRKTGERMSFGKWGSV